jgi:hypothetical protein
MRHEFVARTHPPEPLLRESRGKGFADAAGRRCLRKMHNDPAHESGNVAAAGNGVRICS